MHTPSPKIEEDMKFLKVLPVKQFSGKNGNWSLRYIWPTVAITPLHQNSQLVFQIELEIFNFHPFDTLTPSVKIGEVMEFQRGLSVKRKLDSSLKLCWNSSI
jgi:hypothetical protein